MRKTYLSQVRNHNKSLYYLFILIIVATLITNIAHNQATPIYVWDMYAGQTEEPTSYKVFSFTYNEKEMNVPVWRDHKRMYFYYTVNHYLQCVNNQNMDPFQEKSTQKLPKIGIAPDFLSGLYSTPDEIAGYPQWLKRYMEANTDETFSSMSVKEIDVRYLPSGRIEVLSAKEIIKYPSP